MDRTAGSYQERGRCPLYTAMQVIEGRWKPMICRRLGERPRRFGELRRSMPGVTAKMLRQHLRELERDGIVVRSAQQEPRLSVTYRMTRYGRTLGPVFEALWTWGTKHIERERAII